MNILGLSGSTHDSAACVISDGRVIAAVEQERMSRNKHAPHDLPLDAAKEAMDMAGLTPDDISLVSYFFDPASFKRHVLSHVLLKDPARYFLNWEDYETAKFIRRGHRFAEQAASIAKSLNIEAPIEFVKHHMAHAASAFLLSPFEEAMILSIDNMGELDSTLLACGRGTDIAPVASQDIPHSLGMLYAVITQYLGFKAWDEEGKVMALAAYGEPRIPIGDIIIFHNGRFLLQKDYQMIQTFSKDRLYAEGLVRRLGPARLAGEEITQRHKDIAASVQVAVEETAKYLVTWLHEKAGGTRLCIAGGVAQNCKLNGEIAKLPFLEDLYVCPASGDSGTSIGAAVYSSARRTGKRPAPFLETGIGRSYSGEEIESELKKSGLNYRTSGDEASDAARIILDEEVVAWFQGGSEIGPRALGHRSILGLPQKVTVRDRINNQIKKRESWRPLCPSVLHSSAEKYFDGKSECRFMNMACQSKEFAKERVPAAMHVDGTARIQKVFEREQPLFFKLLKKIGSLTGDPLLLNTSFNAKGEPIVYSPKDALRTFANMPIKTMIMGNFVITK